MSREGIVVKRKIVQVGLVKNKEISSLIREYEKRLGKRRPEVVVVKDGKRSDDDLLRFIKDEKGRNPDFKIILLSEEGVLFSSKEFSEELKKLDLEGQGALFVIGGPDGLSDFLKREADLIISLSRMTFTHEMALLLLYEQLYRAETIISGKKYHRE